MSSENLHAYLRPPASISLSIWGISAALLGCVAWLAIQAYVFYQDAENLTDANARLAARTTARPVPRPNRAEQDISRHWAQLQIERDFPWKHVFQMVEQADSTDIELLGLVPDRRNRTVVLRGQAINHQALIAYLGALSDQPMLNQAYLVHEQTLAKDRLETVSFEIKISLR